MANADSDDDEDDNEQQGLLSLTVAAGEPGRTGGPRARTEPAASFSCQERLKSVILFRGLRRGWLRAGYGGAALATGCPRVFY